MTSINDKVYNMITCLADQYGFDADEGMNLITEKIKEISSVPPWYLIPEIPIEKFIDCLSEIYRVLEKKHTGKTSEDLSIKAVLVGFNSLTFAQWETLERARLAQKVLEMKMGDFHEELIGKFNGWETLPNGHVTECDVRKLDGTHLWEVKNRHNTIKGKDGTHVVSMLKCHADNGIHATLVQINCPKGKVNRFGAAANVNVWNGQQAYEYLSGRASFLDDLNLTLNYVFVNYKTYAELKSIL